MILRVMTDKLTKKETRGERQPWQTTSVTREVLAFGIQPFLHKHQREEGLKAKPTIVAPLNKEKKRPEIGDFARMECVEFLSARKNSLIHVDEVMPAFTALENRSHWHKVIREIKVQEGFAIIGLAVPPPEKRNIFCKKFSANLFKKAY